MEGKYTVYHRRMNYYETDKMGIIHHSNYIRLFEEARLDMLEVYGLDYAAMEKSGIIIPVLSVECKYLQPLHYKDDITIYSKFSKFDGIKMEVDYEIYKDEGNILTTTGHTGHCFLDKDMKPFRMKKLYPDLYKKLNELIKE